MSKPVPVRLDGDVTQALQQLAKAKRLPLSTYIRTIVVEHPDVAALLKTLTEKKGTKV